MIDDDLQFLITYNILKIYNSVGLNISSGDVCRVRKTGQILIIQYSLLRRKDQRPQAAITLLYFLSYSEVLGIGRDAGQSTSKKAYDKLAQQYQPDKSNASDAKEKFAEVNK